MAINTAVFEGTVRGGVSLDKLGDGRSIARYVVVGTSFRRNADGRYERMPAPVNVVTLARQAERDVALLEDGNVVIVHGQIVSWEEDGAVHTVIEGNSVSLVNSAGVGAGTGRRQQAAGARAPRAASSPDSAPAHTPEHAQWLDDYGSDGS